MSRMVSFFVLVAVTLVIGVLFFRVLSAFFLPLFIAAVLVVVFHPLHKWMLKRCHERPKLASGLTTITVMLITLCPTGGVIYFATVEGYAMLSGFDAATVTGKFESLRERFGLSMPLAKPLSDITRAIDHELSIIESGGTPDEVHIEHLFKLCQQPELRQGVEPGEANHLDGLIRSLDRALHADHSPITRNDSIRAAAHHFQAYKVGVNGGPILSMAKELANPTPDQLKRMGDQALWAVQPRIFSVGKATGKALVRIVLGIVITTIALYFFLVDGPAMIETMMRLSPLDNRYERELLNDFEELSRAVVLATLLSALAQAVLAGLGFWFAGVEAVFLLMLLTFVLALIPFVGAAAIWAPASLWLLLIEERTLAAALLAIYGAVVVSMADNVIKPAVLHGRSRLHPLLALLSVLGGVMALGPIGFVIGPMVVVFLQTLLNILHRELTSMESAGSG